MVMNEHHSSQAGNFSDAMETGVDPRTGQFMVTFPLARLVGNHQLGPDLPLALKYSPLSSTDQGFGTGFSLSVSSFNTKANLLQLVNGEQYRVTPGTLIVKNKKLNNFRFALTNGDPSEGYTVFWKDGKTERLTSVGGDGMFVTTRIESPLGRSLKLSWEWSNQSARLRRVEDENTVLLKISYQTSTSMTVWPESPEAYSLVFRLINRNQLTRVTRQISVTEALHWSFEYKQVGHPDKVGRTDSRLTLVGIDYPTGKRERVAYNKEMGFSYPSSSHIRWKLPVALNHTCFPGGDQPETTTEYKYSQRNFLGYQSNDFGSWGADDDYLYQRLTDYTYESTETVTTPTVTIATKRKYNNYHFMIEEEVTRDGHSHRTEISYYAEKYRSFIDQGAHFQLPREKKETMRNSDGGERAMLTLTEFDTDGNPTRQVSPDGTETLTAWFSADGGDGCPAEPNGFTRFIREQTTKPPLATGTEPVRSVKYTYEKLGGEHCVVQKSQSHFCDDKLMSTRHSEYDSNKDSSEFGRVTAITDTVHHKDDESKSYTKRQRFTTSVDAGIMKQTVTFSGHDGLETQSTRSHSVLSGQVVSEVSVHGVETRHEYDSLGRITRRTLCPGSTHEHATSWEYGFDKDRSGPFSTETHGNGSKTKKYFDGHGRLTGQHVLDSGSSQWRELYSCSHDRFGEIASATMKDWITSGAESGKHFPLTSEIAYDAWGEKKEVKFSDDRRTVQHADPVALVRTVQTHAGSGDDQLSSASVVLSLDQKLQLPVSRVVNDSSGKEHSSRRFTWDGVGQLIAEQDELGAVTKRSYDEYGRLAEQTLPDGTVVRKTYPLHLAGSNKVESISVTGKDAEGEVRTWLLGTQSFDSLGRLTKSVSGGRTTCYSYQESSPDPSTVTTPSGKTISYAYIQELGNAVSSVTADGVKKTFTYDLKTGAMLTARESESEVENVFSDNGQLKEEKFTNESATRHASHTQTLKGTPASYTDVTGKETRYTMDDHGRLVTITDASATVNLTYDALNRVTRRVVADKASPSTLSIDMEYDSLGHESTRTVRDTGGLNLVLTQTWLKNGLLDKRTTCKNGACLKDEQFGYDTRNRLITYRASGGSLLVDGYGHPMKEQLYSYDALNNLTKVTTTLADGSVDTCTYRYENTSDPTQLTTLTHSHRSYPSTISLAYDADGRMTRDEAGRVLTYDSLGRLTSVSDQAKSRSGTYGYNAQNKLVATNANGNDRRDLYYRGDDLVTEVMAATQKEKRLIKAGRTCLAVDDSDGLTLLAGDKSDSLLWSEHSGEGKVHGWSPYGSGDADERLPGFNGERVDPVSGTYHLGNGYRAYSPVLMRFTCPDSLSPFGAGGINPYAYCAGDPVNHTDPSGHLSWQGIVGIVAGVVGLGLAVFTAGASVAAAGGVMAAVSSASVTSLVVGSLGVASDITAIASGAMEDSNPELSSTLGWVSLATGLVGLGEGVARGLMSKMGKSGAKSRSFLGVSRSGDGLSYSNVKVADAREYSWHDRHRRRPTWYHIEHNQKIIVGADQQITAHNVSDELTILLKLRQEGVIAKKPIIILSGTHGEGHGLNWLEMDKKCIRRPSLIEHDFFVEDMPHSKTNPGVHVFDSDGMHKNLYKAFIDSDCHVIMGFCFGRNEQTLVEQLKLPHVQTFSTDYYDRVLAGQISSYDSFSSVWAH